MTANTIWIAFISLSEQMFCQLISKHLSVVFFCITRLVMHLSTKPHCCNKGKLRMRNTCSPAAINSPVGKSFFWNWLGKNQCDLSTEHRSCPGATTAHSPGKKWEEPFSWKRNSRVSTLPLLFLPSLQLLLLWVPMLIHWILGFLFVLACIRCLVWGLEINSGLCVSATSPLKQFESGLCPVKKETTNESWNCRCFCSQWMPGFTGAWR